MADINDTGGKFATGINDTGGKFCHRCQFANNWNNIRLPCVVDSGGKLATGVNVLAANLPPVSICK